MTRAHSFAAADVTRLVKALRKAGEEVASVEIDPTGRIVAKFGRPSGDATAETNPWDDVLTDDTRDQPAPERH